MHRFDLNTLTQFAVVARHLNFRRAAAELAVAPSTLSDRIRELEDALGVRLLNRSTRSASLTDMGRLLLDRTQDALTALEEVTRGFGSSGQDARLAGRVRINGPSPAVELRLMPLVSSFLMKHPHVRIEVVEQGELVDIVASGFDAGVRYDETLTQDMVAVRLGPEQRMLIVGSPEYLKRQGTPETPSDLAEHACIGHVFATGNTLPWSLEREGERVEWVPRGPLLVNSSPAALIAARASLGLTYIFEEYMTEDLADGRLVSVLSDWTPPFPGPSLYFFERRLMPRAMRAFVDHVSQTERWRDRAAPSGAGNAD